MRQSYLFNGFFIGVAAALYPPLYGVVESAGTTTNAEQVQEQREPGERTKKLLGATPGE